MFALKPDFEQVLNRFEAWWEGAVIDRPLVSITVPKPPSQCLPEPVERKWPSQRDRWMDIDYQVETRVSNLSNRIYLGDSLPVTIPNLGPEVFSAFYGCELTFSESTSWTEPILLDWSDASLAALRIDPDNVYYRWILDMTKALLDAGRGRFIVGYTDLHPGGDALAAFRDPQNLLIDTLESPDAIKHVCRQITMDFLGVFDHYHALLSAAGMPSTTWSKSVCKGKMHVPSNDFACMIGDQAFQDLFLPSIVAECRHMDRCLYHLDGPQALRFLDMLLDIPDIHAIQWVPGAGQDYWADWLDVYRRIQARGKSMQILSVPLGDLALLFENLRPEGVWISSLSDVPDIETAHAAIQAISRWQAP